MYPRGDLLQTSETNGFGGTSCQLTGVVGANTYDLPALEVTQGNTASITIDTTILGMCQGYTFSWIIQDEIGSTSRNINNTYLTVTGNTITIDATAQPPYPGFRYWIIQASLTEGATRVVNVPLPVVIWPSNMALPSNITATPNACNTTTAPKSYP